MNEHITGISILGGEPLHPNNITATFNLVKWFKEDFPKKTIWLWSGYTWEELTSKSNSNYKINIGILNNIDVLVDGKYVDELRDISLKWCGSTNQRVINIQESLKENKIVLYN